jgi:hypothetical protein
MIPPCLFYAQGTKPAVAFSLNGPPLHYEWLKGPVPPAHLHGATHILGNMRCEARRGGAGTEEDIAATTDRSFGTPDIIPHEDIASRSPVFSAITPPLPQLITGAPLPAAEDHTGEPTLAWAVQYLHQGREPMYVELSECGQVRCTSLRSGKYVRTAWHGLWKISGTSMALYFRYVTPTLVLIQVNFAFKNRIWQRTEPAIALFDPPQGYEQWLLSHPEWTVETTVEETPTVSY